MGDELPPEFATIRKTELRWSAIVQMFRVLVICLMLYGVARCFLQATIAVAGKETTVRLILQTLANAKIAISLNLGISISLGVLWGRERNLRKTTVQRLHGRIHALELQIAPARSSSGLDERGDTRPEDK